MMVLNPADLPTLNITPSLPHCRDVAMPSSMWHVKSLLEPQGTEIGIKRKIIQRGEAGFKEHPHLIRILTSPESD